MLTAVQVKIQTMVSLILAARLVQLRMAKEEVSESAKEFSSNPEHDDLDYSPLLCSFWCTVSFDGV
jgi:hypothetical protein